MNEAFVRPSFMNEAKKKALARSAMSFDEIFQHFPDHYIKLDISIVCTIFLYICFMKKYLTYKNLIKAIIYVLSFILFPTFTLLATILFFAIGLCISIVLIAIFTIISIFLGRDITESRIKD